MFGLISPYFSLIQFVSNLNCDCNVAKDGRDVTSVTRHLGVTSNGATSFPANKWYHHERPIIPIYEI